LPSALSWRCTPINRLRVVWSGELAQVADDPFATQLFSYRRGSAGTTEEVGNEVSFTAGCIDDPFKQGFGFWVG